MPSSNQLPLPAFYNRDNSRKWGYSPDLQKVYECAMEDRRRHGIKPAGSAKVRIGTLGIDWNKDFVFPEGTLFVGGRSGTGGMDDSANWSEFRYRNARIITDEDDTMDTHFVYQLFFASFHQTQDGQPLSPHTMIDVNGKGLLVNIDLAGNILHENVVPRPEVAVMLGVDYTWLCRQVVYYCQELAKAGKYKLYLWPFHCILGTDGHSLAGNVSECSAYMAFLRGIQPGREIKGGHPLYENYSVLRGEVLTRWDGKGVLGQKNTRLIKKLMDLDILAVGGEAASHCVCSSVDDFLTEIQDVDPKLAKKVYLLEDCMSAVAVPNPAGGFFADFTPQAEAALDKFRNAGMHVVKSTDPIESWPGVTL